MPRAIPARHAVKLAAIVAIAVFAPFAWSPSQGPELNDACAGEGCCFNPQAICDTEHADYEDYENKSVFQIIFGC